jgi:hypothetical protein
MAEHTPGPWRVVTASHGRTVGVVADDQVTVVTIRSASDEDRANARLIAAAPALLAACKALVRRNQKHADLDRAIAAGEAAVAKATGQEGA